MTTTAEDTRSLDDVVGDYRFAQLVTLSGSTLSARPLTVQESRDGVVRFLVSAEAEWLDEATSAPVLVTLSDPKHDSYASVSGAATVTTDDATIDRLWSAPSGAYFDGRDDPNIRVLEVHATGGQFWDGPSGTLGQALTVAKTAVTGKTPGDKGSIDVR